MRKRQKTAHEWYLALYKKASSENFRDGLYEDYFKDAGNFELSANKKKEVNFDTPAKWKNYLLKWKD